MTTRTSRFFRDARGGVAIEFALIGPVLALLLIAVTDFGLGFYRRMQVQTAAQRGAMYVTVYGYAESSVVNTITSTARDVSATPSPSDFWGCPTDTGIVASTKGAPCSSGGSAGRYVSTSARGDYTPIFRYPGLPSPMTFTATNVVRIE